MKNMVFVNAFVKSLFFILLTTAFAFGQNNSGRIDELISMLHKQRQFNGIVLVAEQGKITFKKSYGLANEETKKPIDENTAFELASVSKQFTAMGIVILKERGKLSLEDKITEFFPELSEYKNVTVRNLLNHTGGLPDYINSRSLAFFDQNKINKNKDVINYLVKEKVSLKFEPGTKFEYSNTGYVLLASIIEKVSGKSFGEFLDGNIFKPLKMKNTFVYMRRLAPRKLNNYAFGYGFSEKENKYILPDDEVKFVVFLDGIVGDGNISSTALDLLKWDQALRAGKLISKQSLRDFYAPVTLPDKSTTKYGFGWFIGDNKGDKDFVYHSGGFPGYVTYIGRHLTDNKTLIILQNHDGVALPSRNLWEILYDKPITKIYRQEITVDEKLLERYVGEYRDKSDEKLVVKITKSGNSLTYNSTEHQDWNLKIFPETENFFFAKAANLQIEFTNMKDGEVLLKLHQGGKIISEAVKLNN